MAIEAVQKMSTICNIFFKVVQRAISIMVFSYGILQSRVRKEKAEASLKELECYERYWDFLGKMGYSKKQRRYFFVETNPQLKILDKINEPVANHLTFLISLLKTGGG